MNRQILFDNALFTKHIGSIAIMIIIDVCYFISSVSFGVMELKSLLMAISFVHSILTCILFHIFLISRGELNFELITEKVAYFPTRRVDFLKSKYIFTINLIIIQLVLTTICLGIGNLGSCGMVDSKRILACILMVVISILLTSSCILLLMHINPFAIYLSLLISLPLSYVSKLIAYLLNNTMYTLLFILVTLVLIIYIVCFYVAYKIFKCIC